MCERSLFSQCDLMSRIGFCSSNFLVMSFIMLSFMDTSTGLSVTILLYLLSFVSAVAVSAGDPTTRSYSGLRVHTHCNDSSTIGPPQIVGRSFPIPYQTMICNDLSIC
uniref:Uncharacterized protein n=1 Tax=Physcomitrium patens TaxID=3218 RepID=A0A2K1IJW7_PHYPA|nr:hypothetical protein PHYPA_028255 [Physcomitrium patens]